jgi:hypothetical protein
MVHIAAAQRCRSAIKRSRGRTAVCALPAGPRLAALPLDACQLRTWIAPLPLQFKAGCGDARGAVKS